MLGGAPIYAVLPCVNFERATKFYEQVLGLKRAPLPGDGQDMEGNAMYQCGGGTMLLVYQRPEPTKAEHTSAGWMVDDLDSVVDQLIAKGVKMEVYDMPDVQFDSRGVATMGEMKSAWFQDPEGNILALTQAP